MAKILVVDDEAVLGFTDDIGHTLIGTAIHFHLSENRAKKLEGEAMDNLWLELPWWF